MKALKWTWDIIYHDIKLSRVEYDTYLEEKLQQKGVALFVFCESFLSCGLFLR